MGSITIDGVLIKWLGNTGFMIKGNGMVLYIDPCNLHHEVPVDDMADLLLITHEHFGHCDPDSIRNVRKSECTTLIPGNMSLQFRGDARRVMGGDSLTEDLSIKDVDIEVVATYECHDDTTSLGEGVGYFFVLGGLKVYHAGHTCVIPELVSNSVDVALLPIGVHQVMGQAQATNALTVLSPKVVIPMGYDSDDEAGGNLDTFIGMVNEKFPSAKVVLL
ncbi:MBL fold metallo-hydrolase [Methanolobus psychrotolerans]|uniref:MBL fold metallo-hydrolase n=1 Tax=Methanolobus psychrotolerans TaxID=1874706 RepID=UPI001F5E27CA|nr:MBL fold metallo-hydrolase [Methanolobus psychrotolerans]